MSSEQEEKPHLQVTALLEVGSAVISDAVRLSD